MSDTPYPVKKCICFNVPFELLKESNLSTLEEIRDKFGCSSGCGMCAKYIELMLETGETEFPILWGPEFAAWKRKRLE
jgi:NAD(P)H-nitrite reductase large subunit